MGRKISAAVFTLFVILGFTAEGLACTVCSLTSDAADLNVWMSPVDGVDKIEFTMGLDDCVLCPDMSLVSATLFVNFEDDTDIFDLYEYASISDGYTDTLCEVETGTAVINVSPDGLTALNSQGELTFTLNRMYGDFTCSWAVLTATAQTVTVPVPGTLWLFGPALIGFMRIRRRFTPAHNQGRPTVS